MRILDENENKSLNQVTIYLKITEAKELRDSLESLLNNPIGHHEHIPDEDFSREITVCIYDLSDLNQFNQESKRILLMEE